MPMVRQAITDTDRATARAWFDDSSFARGVIDMMYVEVGGLVVVTVCMDIHTSVAKTMVYTCISNFWIMKIGYLQGQNFLQSHSVLNSGLHKPEQGEHSNAMGSQYSVGSHSPSQSWPGGQSNPFAVVTTMVSTRKHRWRLVRSLLWSILQFRCFQPVLPFVKTAPKWLQCAWVDLLCIKGIASSE